MHDDTTPHQPLDAEAAARLTEAAERCYEQGDYAAASMQYQQALDAWLALRGPDDLDSARSQHGLGVILLELGEYTAAQALLEQALATRERILGPEHPDTAQVLSDLGVTRFCQNEVAGALRLTERALALREQALGPDHPDTIESLNNLGVLINRQGDRARALAIHTEALDRCERALGDHRRTIETLNALAVKLAREQPTYAHARALYERALAMSERVLGATHPVTARLMNNLAAVLADLDMRAEARTMLERSLVLHEQVYGPEHPNTAWVLVNLGDIDQRAHDYAAARARFTRALIIREAALGARDPETVRALRKLVAALGNLGQQGDQAAMLAAMPLHVCLTALDAAADTLASDQWHMPGAHLDPARAAEQLHELVAKLDAERRRAPSTPEAQAALQHAAELERQANDRLAEGEYAAAQALLEEALVAREQAQGPKHMDLVPLLQSLETVLRKLGRSSAVLPIRQRIADIHVAALGEGHPQTQLALLELAGLLDHEYGPGSADAIRDQIFQTMETSLGPDDVFTRMSRDLLTRLRAMRAQREPTTPPDAPRQSRSEKREAALAARRPPEVDVLDGVEQVPWDTLHHAYGSAEDVPDLLRLLLSDDPDVRDDAFEQLYSNIWHQGTVYEASGYAVPFLLRMLADERTPDRLSVLHLLSSLAEGSSYLAVHHREGDAHFDWRRLLAEKGEDFDTELQKELDGVRAANEAVAEGVDLLFGLLEDVDADAELRQQALATIAVLPGRAAASVPRLCALLPATVDPPLRTGIARALHDLMDDSRASQRICADLLRGDEPEAVRLIAAVALLTRAGERAPEQAVTVVLDALRELGMLRHQSGAPAEDRAAWQAIAHRFYPAWGAGPIEFSLDGLIALGGEPARTALLRAVRLLHDSEDAERAASVLLGLVCNDGRRMSSGMAYSRDKQTGRRKIDYWGTPKPPPHQAHELTVTQREVLAALVDHDPLWEHQSNLLELYGLPTERAALRAMLR
jgi:tetratricopeptide (TPR) repeat protein